EGGAAGEGVVLGIVDGGGEGDRRADLVGAGGGALADDVAEVVDDIGVGAGAAGHAVGPGLAVEQVVAGVPGELVGERVAGAVDIGVAKQHQVLERGPEDVAHIALDRVGAGIGRFGDDVAGAVHHIGVV